MGVLSGGSRVTLRHTSIAGSFVVGGAFCLFSVCFCTSLLTGPTRRSRFVLCISCPTPRICPVIPGSFHRRTELLENCHWRIFVATGAFYFNLASALAYVDYVIFIARTFRPCSGLFWEAEAGPASHLEMSLPVSAERWEPLASLGAATERTAHALRRFTTVAQF